MHSTIDKSKDTAKSIRELLDPMNLSTTLNNLKNEASDVDDLKSHMIGSTKYANLLVKSATELNSDTICQIGESIGLYNNINSSSDIIEIICDQSKDSDDDIEKKNSIMKFLINAGWRIPECTNISFTDENECRLILGSAGISEETIASIIDF